MVPAEWLSGDRPGSALTSDNSENSTERAGACQLRSARRTGAYSEAYDDAYVHPAVVGRLTAAVSRMHSTAASRRPFVFLPPELQRGGPPGGDLDQEVE
ncbi:hypothetical protein GCM10027072_35670 [Streptomyces bullii]